MHYYLVDPQQYRGKNFEFYQTQLLSLLGEYHINGEVARVTSLRTAEDLVTTALSHGVTTLVVVGGDETFTRVISVAHGKPVTLGYIPIDDNSEIGEILGLESLDDAVATIAKRRVESLDLASVGPTYFMSNIFFAASHLSRPDSDTGESLISRNITWRNFVAGDTEMVELLFDDSFHASDKFLGGSIISARGAAAEGKYEKLIGNPKDGRLDIVLASRLSRFAAWRYRKVLEARTYESLPHSTIIHAKKIDIKGPAGLQIFLSGRVVATAPVTVKMTNEKLKVIVGKNRPF